ncbi:acyltransferase family protein [Sharpea porci]|uniref:acyltransferase n=1 Tax=Sharpea porci TaxID=2652286 RepID=UPI002A9196A3|nr:acyltransferase family protein [Sharpea porci]MDY5279832.1 acyltransferase family protein [Sharpea porci]
MSTSKAKNQHQIVGFNYLRAIACLAIIILHVHYAASLQYVKTISLQSFVASNVVRNCMMWAVPCFIMVTGALLLNPEHAVSRKKIFTKYIKKVLIALISFVLIYRIFDMVISPEGITVKGFELAVMQFLTGSSWSPLWYLYMLIGLYLLLPIYRKIVSSSKDDDIKYLLFIGLLFLSILPLTQLAGMKLNFTIHIASVYPFYLFLGYAISKQIISMDKKKSVALLLCSLALIIFVSFMRFTYDYEHLDLLLSYSSPLNIILSVSLFQLFINTKEIKSKFVHKLFLSLDKCSFSIYLVHIIFVKLILRVLMINPYKYGMLGLLLLVIVILVLSWLISCFYLKIFTLLKKLSTIKLDSSNK